MEEFTITGDVMTAARGKPVEGIQHMAKSGSLGFWKCLLNELRASFNAPFESDSEKKAGIHWRDLGKL